MILVDTTVVVAYLRSANPQLPALFAAHQAAICASPVRRFCTGSAIHLIRPGLRPHSNGFQQISIPDDLWDEVGALLATLRGAGLPMPFADVVIAALAIHLDIELWSRDQHHFAMQAVVPALRLFQEPPQQQP